MIFPPCRGSKGSGVYQRLFRTADIVTVNSEYTRGRVEALGCPFAKLTSCRWFEPGRLRFFANGL